MRIKLKNKMNIKIKRLHEDAITPKYAKPGDAGMDFFAYESYTLNPDERKLIPTGWAFEIPEGHEMQIRPKSGLALKYGISIVNSPGTIDSGYRGEVGIILINHGEENFNISKGDKIAQGVINQLPLVSLEEVSELSNSERGEGGFGSTGK